MTITIDNLPLYAEALVQAMLEATVLNRYRSSVSVLPVPTHAAACHSLSDLRKAVWAGVLPISTADSQYR